MKAAKNRKAVAHIIVFALLIIFAGKALFNTSEYLFLYLYGIAVTFVILTTFFVTFTRYEDPYETARKKQRASGYSTAPYLVSCMVAVKNEECIINQCINSLISQTYPHKEIIFVNDASTDGTAAVLDEYARQGQIKVIHLNINVGKKRALGKAMAVANGEIFAFSDSDSVWAPDALGKAVQIFSADPLVGAVSGHVRALNANTNLLTKIQDSWYEGQFSIRKAFESVYGAVSCVSGPLAVFRKDAIFNFIPAWENDTFLSREFRFATDRTLTGFVLGSSSIGERLKRQYGTSHFVTNIDYPVRDWKVVYCKSARALTNVPDTAAAMLKQQIRWKKSFIRNIFFTGSFYWRKPFLPSFFYYLHIMFVLFGPIVAFRHLIYLPFRGDLVSIFLYIGGIAFIGFMFGLAYKRENRTCHLWMYRPLMSMLSTLILSWVVYYSAFTIKKAIWYRA
jgi:cellulose synthase/poly-beta-1,6-N-acetylglucosamine synthase-like glycosyltransferase